MKKPQNLSLWNGEIKRMPQQSICSSKIKSFLGRKVTLSSNGAEDYELTH